MTHCIQNRITRRAVLGGAAALGAASLPAFGQGKVVLRISTPCTENMKSRLKSNRARSTGSSHLEP